MSFEVRAPGRICLFGEHSDYLGLDVIPAALDMSMQLVARPRDDKMIKIEYLDTGEQDIFGLGEPVAYGRKRDYVRSAFNVMARLNMKPKHGWNLEIQGDIPMASGLSSSSALTTAAVFSIARMSNHKIRKDRLAEIAFLAEVAEFGESGGKMDHYASAYGGIIHLAFEQRLRVTQLRARPKGFVIGDSLEKKQDTVGDLKFIRETVEAEYEELVRQISGFDRRHTPVNQVYALSRGVAPAARRMAETTLMNRDLTKRALSLLSKATVDPTTLGDMINEHHDYLRDGLGRSTPKIEKLIARSLDAGALGCKINGSGGGGTMLAFAPECQEEVAKAIQDAGGKPHTVSIGRGATLTELDL
ncbi:MAG: GHMP kinase [Candidatus Thorarchaeota archaeon]|nr:GHMP kinase [Candidatus Thorarchaeota archaeon]